MKLFLYFCVLGFTALGLVGVAAARNLELSEISLSMIRKSTAGKVDLPWKAELRAKWSNERSMDAAVELWIELPAHLKVRVATEQAARLESEGPQNFLVTSFPPPELPIRVFFSDQTQEIRGISVKYLATDTAVLLDESCLPNELTMLNEPSLGVSYVAVRCRLMGEFLAVNLSFPHEVTLSGPASMFFSLSPRLYESRFYRQGSYTLVLTMPSGVKEIALSLGLDPMIEKAAVPAVASAGEPEATAQREAIFSAGAELRRHHQERQSVSSLALVAQSLIINEDWPDLKLSLSLPLAEVSRWKIPENEVLEGTAKFETGAFRGWRSFTGAKYLYMLRGNGASEDLKAWGLESTLEKYFSGLMVSVGGALLAGSRIQPGYSAELRLARPVSSAVDAGYFFIRYETGEVDSGRTDFNTLGVGFGGKF